MNTHQYRGPAAQAATAASPVPEPAEINVPDVHFAAPRSIQLPLRLEQCDPRAAGRDQGRPLSVPWVLQGEAAIPFLPLQLHPAQVSPYSHLPRSLPGEKIWTGFMIAQTVLSLLLCRQNRWARKPQTLPEQTLYWLAPPPAWFYFK